MMMELHRNPKNQLLTEPQIETMSNERRKSEHNTPLTLPTNCSKVADARYIHYNDRLMFKASPKGVQTVVFAGIAVANTTIITAEQTMKKSLNSLNYSVMKADELRFNV